VVKKFSHDTNYYLNIIRKKKGLASQKTFLRGKKLSIGIQVLRKGDDYGEPAHRNGEVYFCLSGNATLKIGKKDFKVSKGMAMYVPSKVIHRFYNVKKEFVFLFIFAGLDD
jgi:mannose-6-phosphate isomerase-like protein (cupin superfamily)